jgi:hypothetical protein
MLQTTIRPHSKVSHSSIVVPHSWSENWDAPKWTGGCLEAPLHDRSVNLSLDSRPTHPPSHFSQMCPLMISSQELSRLLFDLIWIGSWKQLHLMLTFPRRSPPIAVAMISQTSKSLFFILITHRRREGTCGMFLKKCP